MSSTSTPGLPTPESSAHHFPGAGFFKATVAALKSRIVSGLILALPIALTFWIIYQLYLVLNGALNYPALVVRYLIGLRPGFDADSAWLQWVSPLIAMGLALGLLYILGLFTRSWVHRAIDWVLLHVPVVTTIYKAIRNVFQSLDNQMQGNSFKRVVLIPYPYEGSKVLGFVTKTLSDATTGQAIACVCVLTGVMPPAGITLFVPEENVIDVDWTVNQAIQAIVSGGITIPSVIHYTRGIDVPPTGPIVDHAGHPIQTAPSKDYRGVDSDF